MQYSFLKNEFKVYSIHYFKIVSILLLLGIPLSTTAQTDPSQPNILLIIADDLGVDYSNGYQQNQLVPNTPVLDSLRSVGVTFKNAWAAPACTPTRSAIMSGKYGIKTGVTGIPGNLDLTHSSIFTELENQTSGAYSDAVIGKWHISSPADYNHPSQHNVDHYEGVFGSGVDDYYNWTKVEDNMTSTETEYVTTHFTNSSIDWINQQNQAWFLWLAHCTPHAPYHIPPDSMYTSASVSNNKRKYRAMIESMDFDIGRLLDNIPADVLANTIVIYIGDNGAGDGVNQGYGDGQSKNTLYQAGVHVPMIVAGAGVTRQGEEENGLVHAADIYASILEIAGVDLPGGIYNSYSFTPLLTDATAPTRPFNYSELDNQGVNGWTIRDAQYKLIEYLDGSQEFYDLLADPLETQSLIDSLNTNQQTVKNSLEEEAFDIRNDWSCQDLIENGDEIGIDMGCTDFVCTDTSPTSTTNIGCCATPAFPSEYTEVVYDGKRTIYSNMFPDHDYCFSGNNIPEPFDHIFQIPVSPTMGTEPTSVLNNNNRPDRFFWYSSKWGHFCPCPCPAFRFSRYQYSRIQLGLGL